MAYLPPMTDATATDINNITCTNFMLLSRCFLLDLDDKTDANANARVRYILKFRENKSI